ncbi:MAG: hypothetical protein ACOC3X_02120 [Nanoarchaeota archaeon]
METDILKTDVDKFIKLVRQKEKITVSEASKLLNLSEKIVQAWTDFLVEEKILGTEYKFTTQYIYLNYDKDLELNKSNDGEEDIKEMFFRKARLKQISELKIKEMWKKYLNENQFNIKEKFFKKCKEKLIPDEKVDELWLKYFSILKED